MKRLDAAALILIALCAAVLLLRLGSVPAMSLDEAWIGLFAERLRHAGVNTPHQMNHYTGPLYARLVGAFFAARDSSLETLRLPGALLNAAAIAGLWLHLRRRVSDEAAASWALLAAGSAFLLMKSRLAWEVYALHPLLVLGTAWAVSAPARWPALAALAVLGTQNHFIFLSIPASLVVLFGARAGRLGEREALPFLRGSAAALAAGAAFALIKSPLSDELWTAHRPALAAALIAVPAFAAAVAARLPDELLLLPFTRARRAVSAAAALAAFAFLVWHVFPLAQILAGPVVLKRLFAYETPLLLSLPLHALGLFLAGLAAWSAVRAWYDRRLPFHERTLLLWPAAYAVVFVLFRHTSSLRYYSLPSLLVMLALAAALPRLAHADKKSVYAGIGCAALLTQLFLIRELAAPADRRPLSFRVGWRKENSKDFSRKEDLFAAFDASGACKVGHPERSFTAIPLFFHRHAKGPVPCDPALAFDSDQCPECESAPFYRWSVVAAP